MRLLLVGLLVAVSAVWAEDDTAAKLTVTTLTDTELLLEWKIEGIAEESITDKTFLTIDDKEKEIAAVDWFVLRDRAAEKEYKIQIRGTYLDGKDEKPYKTDEVTGKTFKKDLLKPTVTVKNQTKEGIVVDWNIPEEHPECSFNVSLYRKGVTENATTLVKPAGSENATIKEFSPFTEYDVTVTSVCGYGRVNRTWPSDRLPAYVIDMPATRLNVTAISPTQVLLNYSHDAREDADGSPIEFKDVLMQDDKEIPQTNIVDKLTPLKKYVFAYKITHEYNGNKVESTPIEDTVETLAEDFLLPANLTVNPGTNQSVSVSWSLDNNIEGGHCRFDAQLCKAPEDKECVQKQELTWESREVNFTDVAPFTHFVVHVTTMCRYGTDTNIPWPAKKLFYLAHVPKAELWATAISTSEVQLEWNYEEVKDADGKVVIFATEVLRDGNTTKVKDAEKQLLVEGLESGQEHVFEVRLSYTWEDSIVNDTSDAYKVKTFEEGYLDPVIEKPTVSASGVFTTWSLRENRTECDFFASFCLPNATDCKQEEVDHDPNAKVANKTFDDFHAFTEYELSVTAECHYTVANRSWTSLMPVFTAYAPEPTLNLSSISESAVKLTWTADEVKNSTGEVVDFSAQVWLTTDKETEKKDVAKNTGAFEVKGLTSGTDYSAKLRLFKAIGNDTCESFSGAVAFTTKGTAPAGSSAVWWVVGVLLVVLVVAIAGFAAYKYKQRHNGFGGGAAYSPAGVRLD